MLDGFVDKANNSGGYNNRDFKLVVRTTEGPWGTGSKESVALVFEDEVCAIIGIQDGRDAHLTEQVAAKSHIAYIECRATEPTLSQAYVPYFFRMVPNDDQQAGAIMELIKKNGGGKTGILSIDSYDAEYAVKSLVKAAARDSDNAPLVIKVDALDQNRIIEKIRNGGTEHLILPFDADMNRDLLVAIKKELPSLQTYGTLHFTMGMERRKIRLRDYEGMFLVSLGPTWVGDTYLWNMARAASSTDAVNLVIEAVQEVGPDRMAIRDYLSKYVGYGYHSGPLSFDELGNRTRKPVFSRIENGKRVIHKSK